VTTQHTTYAHQFWEAATDVMCDLHVTRELGEPATLLEIQLTVLAQEYGIMAVCFLPDCRVRFFDAENNQWFTMQIIGMEYSYVAD